ncbi:hypothetical protein PIB30_053710, partial [Stylosanthes scabra]|nr:hypothetical protein [Stylosanthes scabra]
KTTSLAPAPASTVATSSVCFNNDGSYENAFSLPSSSGDDSHDMSHCLPLLTTAAQCFPFVTATLLVVRMLMMVMFKN